MLINIQFLACISRVSFGGKCFFVGKKKTNFPTFFIMGRKRQKHPKYKAYFDQQRRIMHERFPFLSSQQIRAKILSTWERFSPEKKDDWGSPPLTKLNNGNFSQGSDGTEVSPSYQSPPRHHPQKISPRPNKSSGKKVRFSKPLSDILPIPKSPESSMENSEKSENSDNSENSKKSENSDNSENLENPGSSLPKLDAWPISDEFNSISEHTLVVEQQAQEKESESSEDEEMPSQERNVWPALFGDTTSIWKAVKKKESNEEKEQPMCSLFQETERKHFSKRRILAGLSPTEVKASTDIFEGDDDDDIFI